MTTLQLRTNTREKGSKAETYGRLAGSFLFEKQHTLQLHEWKLNANSQHISRSIRHHHHCHEVKCKEHVSVFCSVSKGPKVNAQDYRVYQIRAVRQAAQWNPIRRG